ncbi:MAG: penicillin-binding transpeptidase domain-containing protein, partial [Thermoguttaceae bacterium]
MFFDWHRFHADEVQTPEIVDSRRRIRICLIGFVVLLLVVMARAVQLEVSQGAAFRNRATKPLSRETRLPGVRGRILARDGTVLACDRQIQALAVRYRRLQDPPDRQWLERTARRRLSRAERKDPQRIKTERQRVAAENTQLAARLARLCGLSMSQWRQRAGRIETRVERIAKSHSRRRGFEEPVAEQFDYHVMAEDLPLEVVAEIEGNPQLYPATKIISRSRRTYPAGSLAAHLLGHLGPVGEEELGDTDVEYGANDLMGRMGLERQYEALLRGRPGTAVELTNHSGEVLRAYRTRQPGVGRDLVLTINPALQRSAEELLDAALERRQMGLQNAEPAGGAIVVVDISNGALLAAASAPRFDPNLFVGGSGEQLTEVLSGKAHPMLDRTSRMAIAPGSVFKTLTAVALLETSTIDPAKQFFCQGYLHHPHQQRCAVYRRHGTGHGDVGLCDALAQSCNVYFFHHATRLGPGPLIDWALKFGFARPTGVDLPGESAGMVPVPVMMRQLEGHRWGVGDTQSLAIGQGSLTTTPLQIARMMAALANGGRLVTPHLVSRLGLTESSDVVDDPIRVARPQAIDGLHPKTLATIRRGLVRVVDDPAGTAHGALWMDDISVAGKTGTAETGPAKTGPAKTVVGR